MISVPAPLASAPKKEKEFVIESENRQYKLKSFISSDICLEVKETEIITCEAFIGNFSLNNLIELSKAFRICDNINEAYDILLSVFESKKISLSKNDNKLSIKMTVDLPGGRTEEVKLILNKKEIAKDSLIEELIKKINQLEEKNKNLESKMNEIIETQKEFKNLFEYEIKEKKKKFDSKIIDSFEDVQFIIQQIIAEYTNINIDSFRSNLLYRATRDGDSKDNFYNKVDNKRKTLCFIKTKKGVRFGCYLDIALQKQKGSSIQDDKSFVFSIDRKKIYNNIKGQYSINIGSNIIDLYDQPICVFENFLSSDKSYTCKTTLRSFSGFTKDYELNNCEQYFSVEELEVFQIN